MSCQFFLLYICHANIIFAIVAVEMFLKKSKEINNEKQKKKSQRKYSPQFKDDTVIP